MKLSELKIKTAVLSYEDTAGNNIAVSVDVDADGKLGDPKEKSFRFYALKSAEARKVETFGSTVEVDDEGNELESFTGYRIDCTDKTGAHALPCIFPKEMLEAVPGWDRQLQALEKGEQFTFDCRYIAVTVNGEKACWITGWYIPE